MPKDLAEVFSDTEVLKVAQKILDAVPVDIGRPPFESAREKGIVINAYRGDTTEEGPDGVEEFKRYCSNHKILFELTKAGHVRSGGYCGEVQL